VSPQLAWSVASVLAALTLRYGYQTMAALRHEPPVADVSPGTGEA
jgi:hypothetical protein